MLQEHAFFLHHHRVLVLDAATGEPLALLEGATLTALRTGALGGVAADALAPPNAAVAAFRRHERELPGELVASARVIVDDRESCLVEAGDLLIPMNEGRFGPDHIAGELGEVLLGRVPGRRDTGEITLFKSVGNALLDAAAGAAALSRAREMAGVPSLHL